MHTKKFSFLFVIFPAVCVTGVSVCALKRLAVLPREALYGFSTQISRLRCVDFPKAPNKKIIK